MAPVIMGNPDRPELGEELAASFCRMDPEIARRFARVSSCRIIALDLTLLRTPALILQCSEDAIASTVVGEYVHKNIPQSRLALLNATGHCPNLSAPQETIAAIRQYLAES